MKQNLITIRISKYLFLLVLLLNIYRCKDDADVCNILHSEIQDSIFLNSSINPLKIRYKLDTSFRKISLQTEYESFKKIQKYLNGSSQILFFAIAESPNDDKVLREEIIRRMRFETNIISKGTLNYFENSEIKGFFANTVTDTLQYRIFEGGNIRRNIKIRVIVSQRNNELSDMCFKNIVESIIIN